MLLVRCNLDNLLLVSVPSSFKTVKDALKLFSEHYSLFPMFDLLHNLHLGILKLMRTLYCGLCKIRRAEP